jgi:valyl-tRNA synthetase
MDLGRLQQLIRDVERHFQNFQYGQAGQQIYDFIWSDFADWYVEIAKEQMKKTRLETRQSRTGACVRYVLAFVTSVHAVRHRRNLGTSSHSALRESPISNLSKDWPNALDRCQVPEPRDPEGWEEAKVADFELIQEIVRSIRNLRAEKNVAPSKKIPATIVRRAKDGFAERANESHRDHSQASTSL